MSYHVDVDDRLRDFNAASSDSARDNAGKALPPRVEGRLLWDFLDEETGQLYRRMLQRLRDGAPDIRFRFRCDSPDRRRLLEMHMSARGDEVAFVVTPVKEQERPTVPLLDASLPVAEDFVVICAWCMRVNVAPDVWVEVEDAVTALGLFQRGPRPRLTHGVCDECAHDLIAMLDDPPSPEKGIVSFGADALP